MKPIRGPRATWTTCGHTLTIIVSLSVLLACLVLIIAAIWTADADLRSRIAWTAVSIGIPALLTAGACAMTHADTYCRRNTLTIPLPWREAVEDDQEATRLEPNS